jgi:hypothetical protein
MFPTGELLFCAADNSVLELGNGKFAKKILLVALAEPNSNANQAFISKVLQAANLDLQNDALFVEVPENAAVNCFNGLAERPQYIFVFGLTPKQVGLQTFVPPYQSLQLNGSTWLFADSLANLEPDREKKGKLWVALKALFLQP